MISVTDDDIARVKIMIEGRNAVNILNNAFNDLMGPPRPGAKHIDPHDIANTGAILRCTLDILIEDGKGNEVFGRKLTESDPTILYNAAIGLAKAVKAGVRL